MARVRINYYDDGNVMDVKIVDDDSEASIFIDSVVVDMSKEEAAKLINDYDEALSILGNIKSYRQSY